MPFASLNLFPHVVQFAGAQIALALAKKSESLPVIYDTRIREFTERLRGIYKSVEYYQQDHIQPFINFEKIKLISKTADSIQGLIEQHRWSLSPTVAEEIKGLLIGCEREISSLI
ncbi:MAG: hypothetical protein PHF35_01625 [Candidatus Moranbacteria bacterium]|nr:hypothetical protein [Candidatus Moranbacteria bacterium]